MLHTANRQGVQEEVIIETEQQTLKNKEVLLSFAGHNWESGAVAWTLSETEQKATVLHLTGSPSGATSVVAEPVEGKVFIVINDDTSQTITIKASGQTGVAVATDKTAIVIGNGDDFVRVTADA